MNTLDYWKECLSNSAGECGLTLTEEQLTRLAEAVENAHDNYGMAFYSPPASDRLNEIEREWKEKVKKLEQESETYRHNAELAVKRALRQSNDANVSIGENGDVMRYGGRIEQIQ